MHHRDLLSLSLCSIGLLLGCGHNAGSGGSGSGGGGGSGGVVNVSTKLPKLPELTNVSVVSDDDSASVTFDPFDGAKDYRIYPLPSDADITVGADGGVVVKNAIYRCAGSRETWVMPGNADPEPQGWSLHANYAAQPSDNQLGYVYVVPGKGRVPVYALGGPMWEDEGWRASRLKIYTTQDSERQDLLGKRWRDEGIAFYVPANADATTQPIYTSDTEEIVAGQGWTHYKRYYYGASKLADHQKDQPVKPTVSFNVLAAAAADEMPLYAVEYTGVADHTELSVGIERFNRAAKQGNSPLWEVLWSGLTAPTTLVVEALDGGCPYQGALSPQALPPSTDGMGKVHHQALMTLDQAQAASMTSEVFINGQHDVTQLPKAIARSFVKASPVPHPKMDWFEAFSPGETLAPFSADPDFPGCDGNCGIRYTSTDYDLTYYALDPHEVMGKRDGWVIAFGPEMGEFWEYLTDAGSDTNGKMRLTPKAQGKMSADTYFHATMEVDIVSTDRRYPQLIISDQVAPVQTNLVNGNTIVIETIQGPNTELQIQVCDHRTWDVNNQCPKLPLVDPALMGLAPFDPLFEHAGGDRRAKFDVYASTKRVYVLIDGKPAGCANLPAAGVPSGAVSVTFGDVLYHEGAEVTLQPEPYEFHHAHLFTEERRHFDNLGFSSGVPAPAYDEVKFPCAP